MLCLLLPVLLAFALPTSMRTVEVRLNGGPLATGVLAPPGDEVYVPVVSLIRAVDGDPPLSQVHLRVEGWSLFAAAEGGCDTCLVAVRRPVRISARLRMIGIEPHIPLSDLVRAFEGKLEVDTAASVYTIHAGDCHWCVLEARSPTSAVTEADASQ